MKEIKQIIPVPFGLSKNAEVLWNSVAGRRASSPERLAFLESALRELDTADESNRLIKEQGLTVVTPKSGAIHINPLIKLELQSRALFAKLWVQLGFRYDPPKPVRFEDLKIN